MKLGFFAASFLLRPVSGAQSLSGEWDATVKANGVDVPCRFQIAQQGSSIQGTFFNGEELYPSTSGSFSNGLADVEFRVHLRQTGGRLSRRQISGHLPQHSRQLWIYGGAPCGSSAARQPARPRSMATGRSPTRAPRASRPGNSWCGRTGPFPRRFDSAHRRRYRRADRRLARRQVYAEPFLRARGRRCWK